MSEQQPARQHTSRAQQAIVLLVILAFLTLGALTLVYDREPSYQGKTAASQRADR